MDIDTSWIELPNNHPTYISGTIKFIKLAKEGLVDGKALCPCKKCRVDEWLTIPEIEEHILFQGFDKRYKIWIFHGRGPVLEHMFSDQHGSIGDVAGSTSQRAQHGVIGRDDMRGFLGYAFGVNMSNVNELEPVYPHHVGSSDQSEPNFFCHSSINEPTPSATQVMNEKEKANFERLLEASNKELYDGCKTFSKLSFLVRMFHIQCMHHLSAESFTMILELLIEAFPQIMEFPSSFYESKRMINTLGLWYEKIDACPNNYILYRGEHSDKDEYDVCHASRWKTTKSKEGSTSGENKDVKKDKPAKVFRYFPLIPRLKRLFMSSRTAEDMIWHEKDRDKQEGILRHPADASAWKDFDDKYRDFSSDPRSVRLGLASDGFNPYYEYHA
ncbi:uncharacterized protein LOC110684923 isoform X1 [Chenopodium quinoa]|uniref:uncharacterized protein LOC110684923 isoform X1 n=1 Tax=Chenopodium quinoa TaxID=63459 RepID=UPI000B791D12|nr:uncharacterized protein LOC110684923 isoform X1 [Chenopodium quinoa]